MKHKKLLAILTLVCFMFTLVPVAAFAAEGTPVAEVNGVKYTDLQYAIDAANSGDTVTLLRDINYTEGHTFVNNYVVIDKSLTLDLGQYTITNTIENIACPFPGNPYGFRNYPAALYVRNGSIGTNSEPGAINVVIDATDGGIIAEGDDKVAIVSGNIQKTETETDESDYRKTNLTIDGGNYTGSRFCIFHNNGLLTINDGTYQDTYTGTEPQHVLYAHRYDYFFGDFVIEGGSFKGFNPACALMHGGEYSSATGSAKHWHGYVPAGKTGVLDDEGWYTVADGSRVVQRTPEHKLTSSSYVCHCYASLQDAADAGETDLTLLGAVTEDFAIKNNITLNLGDFALNGEISVVDGAFKVGDEHEAGKTSDINGVTVTIKGNSDDNADIILKAPNLGHHTFLGWCYGTNENVTYTDEDRAAGKWEVTLGETYHAHWQHSSYTALPDSELHKTFTMTYGNNEITPSNARVEFDPGDDNDGHKIIAFEQGEYFTTTTSGALTVEITPKNTVQQLNAGSYTDTIYVTVEDGSRHSITVILVIEQAESAVTTDAITAAYGEEIALRAQVGTQTTVNSRAARQERVVFTYNDTPLGNAVVVNGEATLHYDTSEGIIPLGTNTIDVAYSGGNNLLASNGQVTVTLTLPETIVDGKTVEIVTPDGMIVITGPVTIDRNGNITIGGNGSITTETGTVITAPAGGSVTIPTEKLNEVVNDADNNIILPEGSTVEIAAPNGNIVITAPATVDEEGNITLGTGGSAEIGDTTVTGEVVVSPNGTITVAPYKEAEITTPEGAEAVITGPVVVDREGNITVEESGRVVVGDTSVTGPASMDSEGNITVEDNGSVIVGDNVVTGPASVDTEGNVTVENGGTITTENNTVVTAPEDGAITVPADKLSEVTTDDKGNVVLPSGSVVTKGDTVTVLPNGGSVAADGTVTVNPAPEEEPDTPVYSGSSSGFSGVYNYQVAVAQPSNGTIKLSDSNAVKGETVIVTATPNNGYGTAAVIVTDGDGDTIAVTDLQNGTYSFVMPEGKVSVTAVFKDAIVLKIGDNNMNVFGKTVANDVAPQIKDDYTMLPIRPVVEALDGDVAWDADTQKITVKLKGKTVVMYVGEKVGYINGVATEMDVASYIDNSRAFYQLRFVAAATGTDIHWNKATYEVTLIPE